MMELKITTLFSIFGFLVSTTLALDYVLLAPKEIRVGVDEKIVLNLHGYGDGQVTVRAYYLTLPRYRGRSQETLVQAAASEPIEFTVRINPEEIVEPASRQANMYVELNVELLDSNSNRHIKSKMLLNYQSGYIFLMTDRPAYRPGDTVKMSLAAFDQNAQLTLEQHKIAISVKTPEETGSVTVDYQEVTSGNINEYLSHEFKIAEEVVTGVYQVFAKIKELEIETSASFKVERYVLPAFDISITMDRHFILPTDEDFMFTITAQYSYIEPVFGSYHIKVLLNRPGQQDPIEVFKLPRRFNQFARFNDGKRDISFPVEHITDALNDGEDLATLMAEEATLTIIATVTSQSYADTETDVATGIRFTASPYEFNTDRSSRYFMAGFIYQVKADVIDAVTKQPVPNVDCEIEVGGVTIDVRSDKRGQIFHQVDSVNANQMEITIRTKIDDNNRETTFTVQKNTSPEYLGIRLDKSFYSVGENIQITFRFTGDAVPPHINYHVVARGQIVTSGHVKLNVDVAGDKAHQIPATQVMVPSARLIAYYMRNGQVISNSIWFDLEDICDGEELTVRTSDKEVLPELGVEVFVQGNADSLVMVKAVDRSAYFVYNESRLDRNSVWEAMDEYDTACSREGGANSKNVFEESGLYVRSVNIDPSIYEDPVCGAANSRRKRAALSSVPESNSQAIRAKFTIDQCGIDGMRMRAGKPQTCKERADIVLKNTLDFNCAKVYFQNCTVQDKAQRIISSGRKQENAAQRALKNGNAAPRTRFEENWIWKSAVLDGNGLLTLQETAPGSITSFDFTAMSANPDHQVCVAKPATVRVFKDIFIKMHLPYTLNTMEQANIRYTLFNYGNQPQAIDIRMKHGKELCSVYGEGQFHTIETILIDRGSSQSRHFTVMPIDATSGTTTIEMQAGLGDRLKRELRIEPAGARKSVSNSWMIEDSSEIDINFNLPNDGYVLGSRKCWIYAFGNPLGPLLEVDKVSGSYNNLDGLIRAPGGCGEQNMIRVAPSVYVYNYKKATEKWTEGSAEEDRAIAQINRGYQIQLGHRTDASRVALRPFAVYHHHPPSTWLNALVIKTFKEAHVIHPGLDTQPLCNALTWLLDTQQADDGHFRENKHVYHREMDGLIDGEVSLTAYVAVSIQEVGEICPGINPSKLLESKSRAFDYFKTKVAQLGKYALSLASYAIWSEIPGDGLAAQFYDRLWEVRTEDAANNMVYWSTGGKAGSIETTSYALLASVRRAKSQPLNEENMSRTKSIARWLISQRNENGGFQATADTIVGLQAMTEYMEWITNAQVPAPPATNLEISLRSKVNTEWFEQPGVIVGSGLNDGLRAELEVPEGIVGPDTVTATVRGNGEGSLSYRCVYRQKTGSEFCPFNIDVATEPAAGDDVLTIMVTVSKKEEPAAGMSMIEIGLLSGYEAIEDSLNDLLVNNVVDGQADRFEVTDQNVVFYIATIGAEPMRLAFQLRQLSVVDHPHPAEIKVYDYYEPEMACTKFYSRDDNTKVKTVCTEPDANEKSMCRCAEGGCMECRPWNDILTKTKCLDGSEAWECDTCAVNQVGCFNLKDKACTSHFLYLVKVNRVLQDEDGFRPFEAEIVDIYRRGTDDVESGGVRTFRIRSDCFEACHDPAFQEGEDYINTDRWLYIAGRAPDVNKKANGEKTYTYVLDANAGFIQRHLPEPKCQKARDPNLRKNIKCRDNPDGKGCEKIRQRKTICKLQEDFETKLGEGCDK